MAQTIRKVGVIGAGQMGNGIAHVCALAGFDVADHDVSADRIKDALATINGNMARQVSKKVITEDQRQAALEAHRRRGKAGRLLRFRSGDRIRDREGRRQAQDLH